MSDKKQLIGGSWQQKIKSVICKLEILNPEDILESIQFQNHPLNQIIFGQHTTV